ncbi:MAG: DUF2061 domain-containing protein [Promethearchaeota archaeon]
MGFLKNLIKSLVYRSITIFLGIITAYVVTGDINAALGLSLATEGVQSINYFLFESVWSYFDEKKLRAKIAKEFREREIELKLSLGVIIDISKEFSQIDTFIPELYNSISKFYNRILNTKELSEFHEQIKKYKDIFEITNKDRGFDEIRKNNIENKEING